MPESLTNEIQKLTIPERILLVEEIWDGIARENEAFELSSNQRAELDRRSGSFASSGGRTLEEIKAEFLKT
jgi:putative addiction module component (TIGR02574 family)